MSIAVDILSSILASGATAAGCTWYAKRTIEHGFNVVLADRRATFETTLEEKRQAFQRDIEGQRQAAVASLEAFKTQLTLDAEMGRQVAASRMKAIGSIVEKSTEMFLAFEHPDAELAGESPARDFWDVSGEMHHLLRSTAHLFSEETTREFFSRYDEITETVNRFRGRGEPRDEYDRDNGIVEQSCLKIREVARQELKANARVGGE